MLEQIVDLGNRGVGGHQRMRRSDIGIARRLNTIAAGQRLDNFLRRQAIGLKLLRIDIDDDGSLIATKGRR